MYKTTIRSDRSGGDYLRELWRYRELFYVLCWRELKVRYKQTVLGVAWAVLRPLATMVIMTFIFQRVAGLSGDGTSYPVLVLTGILAWQFFSTGLSQGAQSLIADQAIIAKVYFPRLILPISSILTAAVDFLIVLALLLSFMLFTQTPISWTLLGLPLFLLWLFVLTVGIALLLASLNVRYRDFRYILPLLLQLGFYASPVGFPTTAVPARYLSYFQLNPLVGLIDGFRWALLGTPFPQPASLVSGGGVTLLLVASGIYAFRNIEREITDII